MYAIWVIGMILIFIIGLCVVAWLDGKGDLNQDAGDAMMTVMLIAMFWPIPIFVAIVAGPFVGLYALIKRIAEKRG